jgi:hypothetical protein
MARLEAAPFQNKIKNTASCCSRAAPGNRQNGLYSLLRNTVEEPRELKGRAEKGDLFTALKRCATQDQSSLANFIAVREPFKVRAIHRRPPKKLVGRRSTGGWRDRGLQPRPAPELLMKACQRPLPDPRYATPESRRPLLACPAQSS